MRFTTFMTVLGALLTSMFLTPVVPDCRAELCAFDQVPAATLLFPFVGYDYNEPDDGLNTVISITNMSPRAQIVWVQIWTDMAQPLLGFNLVLSGYDVERIDMRELLRDGKMPRSGTWGELAVAAGSPPRAAGPVSGANAPWVDELLPAGEGSGSLLLRCHGDYDGYSDHPDLDEHDLQTLQFFAQASQRPYKMHTDCVGTSYTIDPVADWWELRDESTTSWMYITADVVWDCSTVKPFAADYWRTPSQGGRAWYHNVLTGDVVWTVGSHATMDHAVHIEADPDLAEVATLIDGDPVSFYYRYSTANGVTSDGREPLPTAWAMRYRGAYRAGLETTIRVWKQPILPPQPLNDLITTADGVLLAKDCMAYTYYVWDENEHYYFVDCSRHECFFLEEVYPNLLPLTVQEIPVYDLKSADEDGWFLFVWPSSNTEVEYAPVREPVLYQTWMGVSYADKSSDRLLPLGAASGWVAAHYSCSSDQVLPNLGIGGGTAWEWESGRGGGE